MAKPKYAIVMSATEKYLPGVNGQLNACRYYGMEDDGVEFHLIHAFPDSSDYIQRAHKTFPNFVSIKLDDFMIESGRWKKPEKRTKSVLKFSRWLYPAERLSDYDAICVMDADMQIVNSFTHHFDMIAKSDMIALPKNDWSEAEWFSYDEKRAMSANPPITAVPFFITGKRAAEFFPLIPEYAMNPNKYYPPYHTRRGNTTGDMHPVNLILLQTGMINDFFPLQGTQWALINTSHVQLARREIGGRQYIGVHQRGDLLYSYHRKYWSPNVCMRHMGGGNTPIENIFAITNTLLLWQFIKFFNTERDLRIPWIHGDFPGKPLSRVSARWLEDCIRQSNINHRILHGDIIDELNNVIEAGADRIYKLSEKAIDQLVQLGVPLIAALNKQW